MATGARVTNARHAIRWRHQHHRTANELCSHGPSMRSHQDERIPNAALGHVTAIHRSLARTYLSSTGAVFRIDIYTFHTCAPYNTAASLLAAISILVNNKSCHLSSVLGKSQEIITFARGSGELILSTNFDFANDELLSNVYKEKRQSNIGNLLLVKMHIRTQLNVFRVV